MSEQDTNRPRNDDATGGEGPSVERSDTGGHSPPVARAAREESHERREPDDRDVYPVTPVGRVGDDADESALNTTAGLGDEVEELIDHEDEQPDGLSSPPVMPTVDVPRVRPRGRRSARDRTMVSSREAARATRALTPEQRLLTLDAWQRSGLPAKDFAGLVGVSTGTLYTWRRRFNEQGPAGLTDQQRGPRASGSRIAEPTRRAILMLKDANPSWGCQRISDVLYRGPGLPASATAVARVLKDAGYDSTPEATAPHPDRVRRFERATPNQMWQTDLFTFVLKRQNRRVYLVAFMDDHSRFIVSYALHGAQTADFVLESLREGIASYGAPKEVLTDNGSQYVTWRGKSRFRKELEKRGIAHVVARPRHPQTLGKVERFWGTLWRECLESAVFADVADARTRIGYFIDWYNFRRPHQGIEGLVPADRFFSSASEVKRTLAARVQANALELARDGQPKSPFYMTGQVAGRPFSVHAEGERVVMVSESGDRREVELTAPVSRVQDDSSHLDDVTHESDGEIDRERDAHGTHDADRPDARRIDAEEVSDEA